MTSLKVSDITIILVEDSVEELLEDLKRKSLGERVAMEAMEKGREDLIIAGGALTLETMRIFDCDLLTISEYGLREGIVLDALNQRIRTDGISK